MRDSLRRAALRDVDDPLTMDRLAHQLLPPKRGREVRIVGDDPMKYVPADLGDFKLRYCADRMVHSVENEQVEVAKVAWNGEVHGLAAAVAQASVVTGPAFQDQIDRARSVAFADQVAPRRDRARRLSCKPRQLVPIRVRQYRILLETASEGVWHASAR